MRVIMKKIKDVINKTWGIFINNFKVTMASLLVSLFWVIFLTVDEVKDTETEIKIKLILQIIQLKMIKIFLIVAKLIRTTKPQRKISLIFFSKHFSN